MDASDIFDDIVTLIDSMKNNYSSPSDYFLVYKTEDSIDFKKGYQEGFQLACSEILRIIQERRQSFE